MKPRLASAAVGLLILAPAVWHGSPWFTVLAAAVAAVGALELASMIRSWGGRALGPAAGAAAAGLVVAGHFLADAQSPWTAAPPVVSVGAGLSLGWLLTRPRGASGVSSLVAAAAAGLLIGGLLLHAPLLRALEGGRDWMLFLLLATFSADTSAFLVGRTLGRRPLARAISPSKTWEGAAGGLIGAAAMAAALHYIPYIQLGMGVGSIIGLGALIAVVGQAGDLAVSRMKRMAGVKDSGTVVPGHGGVLDRVDSIVFNLVVVYYLVS